MLMDEMEHLKIICKNDQQFGVNSYCIVSDNHAVVIDPVLTADFESVLSKYIIDFSVLTHEHYDHICGVNDFHQKYKAPVLCGMKAVNGLSDSSVNMSRYAEYLVTVISFGNHELESLDYRCLADDILVDEQVIDWQGHKLLIKETPGHSIGSISILLDRKYLFSGDTVFKDYPTATRMPGGSTKAFRTITEPWLDTLPQDIMVYPGHTEPFRLFERYKTSH
jgi:hydroxyacylglutathione hydrolase